MQEMGRQLRRRPSRDRAPKGINPIISPTISTPAMHTVVLPEFAHALCYGVTTSAKSCINPSAIRFTATLYAVVAIGRRPLLRY